MPSPDLVGPVRVLLVSDIRLYRDGLAYSIERRERMRVAGVSNNAKDAITQARALNPDVALVDTLLPQALVAIRAIALLESAPAVLGLALTETENAVLECLEAGAVGYLSREGSIEDLIDVIASAGRGELKCSPRVAGTMSRRLRTLVSGVPATQSSTQLTTREQEIVGLIDQGLSNKAIARHLSIEIATVKNHVHHILEKLQVQRRTEVGARVRASAEVGGYRSSRALEALGQSHR